MVTILGGSSHEDSPILGEICMSQLTDEELEKRLNAALDDPGVLAASGWVDPNTSKPVDNIKYQERAQKNADAIGRMFGLAHNDR